MISEKTINDFVTEFGNLKLDNPITIKNYNTLISIIDNNPLFED